MSSSEHHVFSTLGLAAALSAGAIACRGNISPAIEAAGAQQSVDAIAAEGGASAGAATALPADAPLTLGETPVAASPYNCDDANLLVCDGFETLSAGSPPDANRWSIVTPQAAAAAESTMSAPISISSALAHRGQQSLHIHSGAGEAHLVMRDSNSFRSGPAFLPAPNNTFYVRLWLYDDGAAGDHNVIPPASSHLYVINASGPLDGRRQYIKFGAGDGPSGPAALNWNYYGNDAIVIDDNFPWPMGVWTCFEALFNGSSGELKVWQNDSIVPGLSIAAGTWQAPVFDTVMIGWELDHPPGSFAGSDIYIDDVAYSYERIGCAP